MRAGGAGRPPRGRATCLIDTVKDARCFMKRRRLPDQLLEPSGAMDCTYDQAVRTMHRPGIRS